jgi:CheY-like chemotaxis protein
LAKYRGIDPSTLWFKQEDVIMVVDDLPDTRRYLRSLFEPFCKVVEAKDGHSALHMFDETKPDLIIADVMMRRVSTTSCQG